MAEDVPPGLGPPSSRVNRVAPEPGGTSPSFPQTPPPILGPPLRFHARFRSLLQRIPQPRLRVFVLAGLSVLAVVSVVLWGLRARSVPVAWSDVSQFPGEVHGVIAVRPQTPLGVRFLPTLLAGVPGIPAEQFSAAQVMGLLYVEPSLAAPILFVDAKSAPSARDLPAGLERRPYRRWMFIGPATTLRRLGAPSRSPSSQWDALARTISPDAEALIAGDAFPLSAVAQMVAFPPGNSPSSVGLALLPAGGENLVRVRLLGGAAPPSSPLAGAAQEAAHQVFRRLPPSLVAARTHHVQSLRAFLEAENLPESLPPLQRELRARADLLEQVFAALKGPVILGALFGAGPTAADGFLLAPIDATDKVREALRGLEAAAVSAAPVLTGAPAGPQPFSDREHQGVQIRYVNFGSPQRTVDYALTEDLLVVSTSKASMFALIEALRGVGGALGDHPVLRSLPQSGEGHAIVLRPEAVSARSASFGAVVQALVRAVVLAPTGEGTWEGTSPLL